MKQGAGGGTLIGFLDNSWYQKQARSLHRLTAPKEQIGYFMVRVEGG